MKKIITTAILLAATATSFAQDVNKLIKQDDVDRIIKTLSADDMQGRGIYTPGIDKAATFIAGEFKQIGLKPFIADKDFRQNFLMATVTPTNSSVTINGRVISPDSVKISTSLAAVTWNNDPDVQVVRITAEKDFTIESAKLTAHVKKTLVIVDPKFMANVKGRPGRGGGTRVEANDSQALVYVVGNFDDVKSFSVNYAATVKLSAPLFNVAGIIPGKSRPDEYVIFSGHYDHLGILKGNRVMQGDSIANGADDDASGTTAMITLAKYFKKINNNERTLVFVAFTGEESGDLGSGHFARTVDPEKVMAMFNIEMIGKASKWGQNAALITGFDKSSFGTILQKNLTGTNFKFYPDPYIDQNLFLRSDNAALARVGVPAHTISTDQIDIDKLYHTVKDEYSSLDVANITSTIRAVALSSRTIISGQDTPTRVTVMDARR